MNWQTYGQNEATIRLSSTEEPITIRYFFVKSITSTVSITKGNETST